MKTIKFKLTLTKSEKDKLGFDQQKWYYNMINDIFYQKYSTIKDVTKVIGNDTVTQSVKVLDIKKLASIGKFSAITVREMANQYKYRETLSDCGTLTIQEIVPKEENDSKSMTVPSWWISASGKSQVHSRTSRGAAVKYSQNINSAISNYKAGNNKGFIMKNNTSKSNIETLLYEDKQLPGFIKKFNGLYRYTDNRGKRKSISFSDVYKDPEAGSGMLEIVHNKETDEYFIHYPVKSSWFPLSDKRLESQDTFTNKENRVIALDPGVRKHLVGYDPAGESVFIGQDACKKLSELIRKIDEITRVRNEQKKSDTLNVCDRISEHNRNLYLLYEKMKNMVNDLHWKAISFLVRNYDTILYPDYRISGMVRGIKLGRMTKRLMYMFSSYKFRERLTWKCKQYNKKLVIVNESYTSRTCGICGLVKDNLGGSEVFQCSSCKLPMDRDVHAARNILLKNIRLR